MTAVAHGPGPTRLRRARVVAYDTPDLGPTLQLVRAACVVVFVLSTCLLLELTVVGSLQQRAAQQQVFDRFRAELAQGTAPVGPTGADGAALPAGSPVAYLEIPDIGLRQVVVEGTSNGTMFAGPGHRRDSPLPGQAGVSIILGRRATFGGSFARLDQLGAGSLIRTTTGQGVAEFEVTAVRREGDPVPAPVEQGDGRLLLATAAGRPLLPQGVLRVDAELVTPAMAGSPRLVSSQALPSAEQMMAADTGSLWALALWLQALIGVAVAAIWAWHRWGRAQAWVVFLPPLLLVGMQVSNQAARLLPNLT